MKAFHNTATTHMLVFAAMGFEEVFLREVSEASIPYVCIDQDGSEVQIPPSELRQFIQALTDFADKIGAP